MSGGMSGGVATHGLVARAIRPAKRASGDRLIFWTVMAALLSQLTLSANVLDWSGIPYDTPGGLPLIKFHIATYLTVLAAVLQARQQRPVLQHLTARVAAAPLFPLACALMLLVALFTLFSTGISGSAVSIETYAAAALLGFVLERLTAAALRRIGYAMLAVMVGNAVLCIGETLSQHLVVPVLLADPYGFVHELPMVSGEFRGTGLYVHPLAGAMMTLMAVLLCLAVELRPLPKAACMGVLLVGLISFGGRTAMIVGYALLAVLGAGAVIRRLVRRRMTAGLMLATLGGLVAVPAALAVVLFATTLGERIAGKLHVDDSATVRLTQWQVLGQLNLHDWLFGMNGMRMSDALFAIGLEPPWNDIENFWLLVFISLGVVGFVVWLTGLAAMLRRLWTGSALLGRLTLASLLFVASGSNSLGRKSNLLFVCVGVVMAIAAFRPPRPALPSSPPTQPEPRMQRLTAAPSASAVEGLLTTFMANRRALLAVPALILGAAILTALLVPVRYDVQSQLLVALGPEYTFRPQAGEPAAVSQGLDHDATMHTEAEILGSPDLHRATLRDMGAGRLYPDMLRHGPLQGVTAALRRTVAAFGTQTGLFTLAPPQTRDPTDLALLRFDASLSVDTPKLGSVITATFKHPNPVLGAEALNRLVALYIARRAELFRDDQSGIVAGEVATAKAAWLAAETSLAQFKQAHRVESFDAQRDILLRRQGELESDRASAESETAQLQARLDAAHRQVAQVPSAIAAGQETDFETRLAPMRASVEQLRAQYARALQQYQPNAPLVASLRDQLDARQAELSAAGRDGTATTVRSSQNPVWLGLQDEQVKSRTALAAAAARSTQDAGHLAEIGTQLATLDRSEQELSQLQLQLTIAEETYRTDARTLAERQVADDVEARRQPTVRILQPAIAPVSPPPTRRLIVAAGALLAGFGLLMATLLAHAFSRTYWQKEALEQDLGIAVIAVIAEQPARAGGSGLPQLA